MRVETLEGREDRRGGRGGDGVMGKEMGVGR